MNHRQLTLKLKYPEKCDGNILFVTHKKMFYNLARYCDMQPEVKRWMYMVTSESYNSNVDGQQHDAKFDFVVETTAGNYYVKFVSVVKNDKLLNEEVEYLKKACDTKGLVFKPINEMDYKFLK